MTTINLSEVAKRLEKNICIYRIAVLDKGLNREKEEMLSRLVSAIKSDATYYAKRKGDMNNADKGFKGYKDSFMYFVKNIKK